ncbi:unnamed protein product [Didymodactylos carnosus]|uniref:Uncharacterized protein n=1 Tax=Didymodactylos carnosus TaxID=1234261 RepID=A0A814ZGG9_9BILA|nr:unnamed protein product [Didymodactylos carnosus]CAF4006635.1 unnamed protein product [Didymodactylos carnosus]
MCTYEETYPTDVIPKLGKNEICLMIIRCYDLYYTKENASQYSNLSVLQPKRTFTCLINVKYDTSAANKTIVSDDCWNERIGAEELHVHFWLKSAFLLNNFMFIVGDIGLSPQ